MHATPIHSYYDNPLDNMEWLLGLSDDETMVYSKGYIQACNHLRETLTETKSELLFSIMEEMQNKQAQANLTALVALLDLIEQTIEKRLATLRSAGLE